MNPNASVHIHRRWAIFLLPNYVTPYYYAQARWIAGRRVLGPATHQRSLRAVERQIDRELAKGGAQ